ncbi:MAG: hypothetical protein HDQ97_00100 [Lachnospiraceae bacterium]|nr:hypothetical protein [Lachnospiraceae bacterium]
MAEWQTPKTDWISTDKFNIEDFNRIKNNLVYVKEQAALIWGDFEIIDMGEDITSYSAYWDVDKFNAFEANVDIINEHMLSQDYGIRQTFYENGAFIKWDELNRIENAILRMKRIVDGRKASLLRLSFRLGAPNGLKL